MISDTGPAAKEAAGYGEMSEKGALPQKDSPDSGSGVVETRCHQLPSETVAIRVEDVQLREEHWVIAEPSILVTATARQTLPPGSKAVPTASPAHDDSPSAPVKRIDPLRSEDGWADLALFFCATAKGLCPTTDSSSRSVGVDPANGTRGTTSWPGLQKRKR